MVKLTRLSLFLSLLIMTSCFSARKATQTTQNPVSVLPDTALSVKETVISPDSAQVQISDTPSKLAESDSLLTALDSAVQHADTLVMYSDTTYLLTDSITSGQYQLPDTLTIIGTGDIMPGTNYPDERYLPPSCSALFAPVSEVLKSADITFGNLEGVFCKSGGTPKKCNDPTVCYVFRMPDAYLKCILDAGYNLLGVANNHVNDFGPGGRKSTASLLDSSGVHFAGFIDKPYTVFTKDSIKYGFAAFAPHIGTASLKDYDGAAALIRELDRQCDIVIVSFHGGAEGRDYQNVPCTDEIYLGYNRGNVCTFAHRAVEAGADVVFGHGPHVTRAMELYKDRLICYSLGNFCTYARFNLRGPNGIAPIVKVQTNREGKFLGGKIISVYQVGEGGPRIDPQQRALIKLKDLSKIDFPESKLQFDENGKMYSR